QGGIKVMASEVRNIQICSNDIEYNYDLKAKESADILFDCRAGTVREGTLAGNTVQAVQSPGGANVRFLGAKDHPNPGGRVAITGNLLGSQATVLDLHACRGVVISGNSIYSGYQHSIWAEDAEHLVIGGNSIDHNPEYKGNSTDRVVLRRCRNVSVTGLLMQHTRPPSAPTTESMEIRDCQNVSVTGCQIINARERGIALVGCSVLRIADCTIRGRPDDQSYRTPIALRKDCRQLMIVNNFMAAGSEGEWRMPKEMGAATGNVALSAS